MKPKRKEVACALIYFCGKGNNWILPANEKVLLTAIVRGLADIAEICYVEIASHSNSTDDRLSEDGQFFVACGEYRWVNDIRDYTKRSIDAIKYNAAHTVCDTLDCIKEILNLEFKKNKYFNAIMSAFAEIKWQHGLVYGVLTVNFPQEERVKVEESAIPKLSKLSWSAEYFLRVLAEKTATHLKKTLKQLEVEAKSYIDRE